MTDYFWRCPRCRRTGMSDRDVALTCYGLYPHDAEEMVADRRYGNGTGRKVHAPAAHVGGERR